MPHITTCLWARNRHSGRFCPGHDETWVERRYRGFARNLTVPFRFVCLVDTERRFAEPDIEQLAMLTQEPENRALAEAFRLDAPMIHVHLDTIVTGNCDALAEYCMTGKDIAVPSLASGARFYGIALCPAGQRRIFDEWRGEHDVVWWQRQRTVAIDDVVGPGRVVFYPGAELPPDARIVYFGPGCKPSALGHVPWVREHWR
jgi:hypothetical protein